MCLALDVRELAESGLLTPGWHEADVELLGDEISGFSHTTTVVAVMGETSGHLDVEIPDGGELVSGMLLLRWPRERRIEVRRRETAAGHRYSLVCPECPRLVRKLYMAKTPPGILRDWACRHCLGFIYRDTRPGRELYSEACDRLDDLAALEHDIRVLRRVTLQGLDVSSP
jgi:hypothetical protein